MHRLCVAGAAACTLALGVSATALSPAWAAPVTHQAQAPAAPADPASPAAPASPGSTSQLRITSQLVDDAGVLSSGEAASITEILRNGLRDTGTKFSIVFTRNTPGSMSTLAENLVTTEGTDNAAVLVVDVDRRQTGYAAGKAVKTSTISDANSAAVSKFGDDDWAGGAEAAAHAFYGSGGGGSNIGLAVGMGGLVAGATGVAVWSSRRRRKHDAAHANAQAGLSSAAEFTAQKPLADLRALAAEELRSTDESIRIGQQEYDVAVAEFGEERTRPFREALERSRATLNEAWFAQRRIPPVSSPNAPEGRGERATLVSIVESCKAADAVLNAKSAEFAALRNELIDAPALLSDLVQQAVALRARIPRAEQILSDASQRLDPALLRSVADNPALAESLCGEAEKHIERGRELSALPAGKQGEIVDVLGQARHYLHRADEQLSAVENAESTLADARAKLTSLIQEVEHELQEAEQLLRDGGVSNTEALRRVAAEATQVLTSSRQEMEADPLHAYSALLSADASLDKELDEAKGSAGTYARTIDMIDRVCADARQQIASVEETIKTRGVAVGVDARSLLVSAQATVAQAESERTTTPPVALAHAQEAVSLVQQAAAQVRRDLEAHEEMNRPSGGSSAASALPYLFLFSGGGGGFGGSGGFGGGFGGGGGSFGGSGSSSF